MTEPATIAPATQRRSPWLPALGAFGLVGAVVVAAIQGRWLTGDAIAYFRVDGISLDVWQHYHDRVGVLDDAWAAILVAMSVALAVIAVGLRRHRGWAMRAGLRWSLIALGLIAAWAVVIVAVLGPSMDQALAAFPPGRPMANPTIFVVDTLLVDLGLYYLPFPCALGLACRRGLART